MGAHRKSDRSRAYLCAGEYGTKAVKADNNLRVNKVFFLLCSPGVGGRVAASLKSRKKRKASAGAYQVSQPVT